MKLKTSFLAFLIPLVFLVGIEGAKAFGIWSTEDTKEPSRYADAAIDAYDPQSISGASLLVDIATYFEIPIETLTQAFALDESVDLSTFKTKDLEGYYAPMEAEIGNEAVQAFVALYKGLPFDLVDVSLPLQAVEVLKRDGIALTAEQLAYLDEHTVVVAKSTVVPVAETEEAESLISGPTTIQQVLDLGMNLNEFEAIVGAKVSFTNQSVKDFCIENGLSYGTIKTALTTALSD